MILMLLIQGPHFENHCAWESWMTDCLTQLEVRRASQRWKGFSWPSKDGLDFPRWRKEEGAFQGSVVCVAG